MRPGHVRFRLPRGNILCCNNFAAFHHRFAYEDHEEPGLRRHLFPIWLSDPNSHPPHPLFKNNYDATESGALVEG